MFVPLRKIRERVEVARQDSDSNLFFNLLYTGEMILKMVVAGLVSGITDDPERHRYRQLHKLVRADGLGDWCEALDDILVGPASQHLVGPLRTEQRQLTEKVAYGAWQFNAVAKLRSCLKSLDPSGEPLPQKLEGRRWFRLFTEIRNRTRAHGAPSGTTCRKLCPELEESVRLMTSNFFLFSREWAFLHQCLSGKYRITKLTETSKGFEPLKKSSGFKEWGNLQDGVYVFLEKPHLVDLIRSDAEATDFFHPNGNFNGKRFELISYISDNKTAADAVPYLPPASELPLSVTQGERVLDIHGNVFANLPPAPAKYVPRNSLEEDLETRLVDDQHPVITLVGPGGIGKTSLALTVLHEISQSSRYGAIFWFSARDIDLLPEGPKLVRPHLLTEHDIAREFTRLTQPQESSEKGFKPSDYFLAALQKSPLGDPVLFVFDNFETVRHPVDLFIWLENSIRLPNKILITSRFREFKGDFPVDVPGMTEHEFSQLATSTARDLGIERLLTDDYMEDLYRESAGHPYVGKVLLGEVAKAGRLNKIERIIAGKDKILEALFERTYNGLSPSAKLVFLTLCGWRVSVPQLAIEAVLMMPGNERVDTENAVEELRRSSFIDVTVSEEDKEVFVTVPLTASVFGRRKLQVDPFKFTVQANTELLQYFGAAQREDIKRGLSPRVERLFKNVATRLARDPSEAERYTPLLEYVAQRYEPGWLLFASLWEELPLDGAIEKAKMALRRYLGSTSDESERRKAWERLARICSRTQDRVGELHALVEVCDLPGTPYEVLSNTVNQWNGFFRYQQTAVPYDERQLIGKKLHNLMTERIEEGDATDCSRLAWLSLALGNEDQVSDLVERGLRIDPNNEHCLNLKRKFEVHRQR